VRRRMSRERRATGGETNYDERGYKSYNNKGVVVVKPEELQPTKPTKPTKPSKGN
jgi:hypothetical protein